MQEGAAGQACRPLTCVLPEMRTLLIDNYDSFTFNLFQLLAEVNGTAPDVVRNDQVGFAEILAGEYDNIVISPGPGSADNAEDFGVCAEVVRQESIPVLGVCLGHQGLCHYHGGRIDYAPEQMHGRTSQVFHTETGLFEGIPSPFTAVRYHSLVARDLPDCIQKLGWTDDGVLMAVRHVARPLWGVQFHPESICTDHGTRLIRNFYDLTEQCLGRRAHTGGNGKARGNGKAGGNGKARGNGKPRRETARGTGKLSGVSVRYRKLPFYPDSEAAYVNLFGSAQPAFWLDSSLVVEGLSRFSFMGACTAENGELVSYNLSTGKLHVRRRGLVTEHSEDIFGYLSRRIAEMQVSSDDLPFPFPGGYVGYLGYELKSECGGYSRYQHRASTPDAVFVLADRFIAFDHIQKCAYLVGLEGPSLSGLDAWFDHCEARLQAMRRPNPWVRVERVHPIDVELRHCPSEYLARIDESKREIREGNSCEVCLTNQMHIPGRLDKLNCYRALREINPAPYSAYLRFPGVTILSSSPERFLTVTSGRVESKPIKGTFPRGDTPEEDEALKRTLQNSEKDRAENLMIVDLLRNDLGIVCEIGSVRVPKLFDVESYATVHQLVSTIRGQLPAGRSAVDCVRSSFPGGSMTGAPKIRTMEIIDRLEEGPRGVYSGAIGYFGLDGDADLNIVIRTIVAAGDTLSIGVGGAIVSLSDPEAELEETYVKGKALLRTLELTLPESPSLSGHVVGKRFDRTAHSR
jgi:para-aminobenzoate synthetase